MRESPKAAEPGCGPGRDFTQNFSLCLDPSTLNTWVRDSRFALFERREEGEVSTRMVKGVTC